MKKSVLVITCAVFAAFVLPARAGSFASAVVGYTPGAGVGSYNDPTAALGQPGGIVAPGTMFPGVFSPFDPHYETDELTGIGFGGQLMLQLQNFVLVKPGARELGIWSNVGLIDDDYPNGKTTNPAATFSAPRHARVSVSADGVQWFALNGGAVIAFSNPGNFYLNAGPQDPAAPSSPSYADFGKPFTGSLASFDNQTYGEVLGTLDGSAGGTWLDLDSTGLKQVGYILFDNIPSGEVLDINGISINNTLIGALVPEPSALALFGSALAFCSAHRFRRPCAPRV